MFLRFFDLIKNSNTVIHSVTGPKIAALEKDARYRGLKYQGRIMENYDK